MVENGSVLYSEDGSRAELARFPYVLDRSGNYCYGGSQNFFEMKWRRRAGCGATAGAGISACLGIGIRPEGEKDGRPVFSFARYLAHMNRMFGYMKPGLMGYPHWERFRDDFLSFAKDMGTSLRAECLTKWKSAGDAFCFAADAVDRGVPAALLVLTHRAPEMDENTWHWMTVTGYDRGAGTILISNYGRREILKAEMVFEPAAANRVRLVAFFREEE